MRSNMDTKQVAHRSTLGALQRRNLKRKIKDNKLSRSIKKIRADMVEISEGQKRIREGQMEVREKFQEISKEAAKLKEETSQICKQSAANQLRLDLMFQIVKARAENDFAKDESLTQTLRDLMAKQNMSKNQGLKEEH
ncbi:uncharacterized protein [Populus alba]|uniref:Uncharacterized protein n=2 Tax=Populus TaxID=3689 RepID=A0A4U5P3B0_POPAL|nr:uncharacterized protein LOC118036794 isoform X2 [Populus alba]KAJ7010309.1 hypothetical protein NC653_000909 [Populus alba x Populus x berolinensis]TKR90636.1 hypothetical protein D5086_0000231270 [Populus alba]